MNGISKAGPHAFVLMVLTLMGLAGLQPDESQAAALRHAKHFVLPGAETVHDDLYAAGDIVDIQGTVDGDLIAAGRTVTVGGIVTGDVIAAARDVTISGSVGGTVRAGGSTVSVDGTVGHDIVSASGTLLLGPHASVGRDVLAGAGNATFGGRITREVRAGAATSTFNGSVGGNVYAHSKQVRLADGAVLERDLFYTSGNALEKSEGATVRGRVERRTPEGREKRKSPVFGWIQGLVGMLLLGVLFFLLTGAGRRALEVLGRSPWPSLGIGALLALVIPFAAASLFLLGIFFGGWWIALGALVLYFFALAVGYVVTATHLGRWILARAGRDGTNYLLPMALGLVALGLVTVIPFVGKMAAFAAALFGLGALALTWYRTRRAERAAPAPA